MNPVERLRNIFKSNPPPKASKSEKVTIFVNSNSLTTELLDSSANLDSAPSPLLAGNISKYNFHISERLCFVFLLDSGILKKHLSSVRSKGDFSLVYLDPSGNIMNQTQITKRNPSSFARLPFSLLKEGITLSLQFKPFGKESKELARDRIRVAWLN